MVKKDKVVLRVEVPEEFRTRLKAQSTRMKMTMGDLVQHLANDSVTLRELEKDSLQKIDNED